METAYLILMLIAGTATHVLKKIVEKRESDMTFTLNRWLAEYPYKTALTLMAGVGGFLALQAAGELSMVSAFMTGYMANSLGAAAK